MPQEAHGHILNIRQAEGESLRQYVDHFNKEVLQVDEAEDQVILTTFQARLLPGYFLFSINKTSPMTVTQLLHNLYMRRIYGSPS